MNTESGDDQMKEGRCSKPVAVYLSKGLQAPEGQEPLLSRVLGENSPVVLHPCAMPALSVTYRVCRHSWYMTKSQARCLSAFGRSTEVRVAVYPVKRLVLKPRDSMGQVAK